MPSGGHNKLTAGEVKLRGTGRRDRPRGKPDNGNGKKKPKRKTAPIPSLKKIEQAARTGIPGYDPWKNAAGCKFQPERARKGIEFFHKKLVLIRGKFAGHPFKLTPYMMAVVANVHGWYRPDGTRRYRKAFLLIAKKNAKTSLGAGWAIYFTLEDGEEGAENFGAAGNIEQAGEVWKIAWPMVEKSPVLSAKLKLYKGAKSIVHEPSFSSFKVLSKVADTKHGTDTHYLFFDELHIQKTRELLDTLVAGTIARAQPFTFIASTIDHERPSACNEEQKYAEAIRDGLIKNPYYLPVIFKCEPEDWQELVDYWEKHGDLDWDIVRKANPNLGLGPQKDFFREEFQRALDSPTYRNTFMRLHLNIKTDAFECWIPSEAWNRCKGFDVDLKGREGKGGLDLGSWKDFTAFGLCFQIDDEYILKSYFWIPEQGIIERERRDGNIKYSAWVDEEHIRLTPGNVIDFRRVRADINEICKPYKIDQIAIDMKLATQIVQELEDDGFDMVPFGQGMVSMNVPTKLFDSLATSGKLRHDGNPVLSWQVGNVVIETDAAACWKPNRKRSADKIDGVVAGIMALGISITAPKKESAYETQSLAVSK